jgi:uncharacterized Zn-finger protein
MEETKYKHICKKCDYKTKFLYSYTIHLESILHQTGKRKIRSDKVIMEPFKCTKCDFESKNQMNYKSHILNNHSKPEEREAQFPFYCKNCNFGCFSQSSYDTHIDTKKHKMKANN